MNENLNKNKKENKEVKKDCITCKYWPYPNYRSPCLECSDCEDEAINIGNQKKMIIIRIIQEFVEKYKYTEAEGIMLGAFISAGLWTIILYFIF